jgi:NAD(P)-dependent dehydrogenase (short-subunit alcohol dehydrogenase family)
VPGDVSNLADLDRLYATVKEQKGRIDVLFANAGVGDFAALGEITEEHFDWVFAVNVRGLLFCVQKALPLSREGGSIILNASTASVKGLPAMSVYSASKAAVRSFARCWTADLKGRKIRVNTLSPGWIDTPIIDGNRVIREQGVEQFKSQVAAGVPVGRLGASEEIANAALFLASDDSSYITGAELFVDGSLAQV